MYLDTFSDLTDKRKETVRTKIGALHTQGFTPEQISKKVRVSHRSVATAVGNITRRTSSGKKRVR